MEASSVSTLNDTKRDGADVTGPMMPLRRRSLSRKAEVFQTVRSV